MMKNVIQFKAKIRQFKFRLMRYFSEPKTISPISPIANRRPIKSFGF